MPANITARYSRIIPVRFSGVRRTQMIQSIPAKITAFRSSVTAPRSTKEARTPSFNPK